MNFGYRKTVEKSNQLTSLKKKLSTKVLVKSFKFFIYLIVLTIVVCGFFVIGMAKGIIDNAPDISEVNISPTAFSTTVYDNKGKQMEKLVKTGSNRVSVSNIDEIPLYTQHAFVAIEDERFYEHNGIDIKGILRAGASVFSSGRLSQGASTITQQLLKNNVFTNWTNADDISKIKRKLQEQYLAVELEKHVNKKVILLNYLNTINLGSNCLGIQAASKRYFNKDVSKLTISESAVIAGITQNPSGYNPITHPDANAKRRDKILANMLKHNYITKEEYDEAKADDVYDRIQLVDSQIGETSPYTYFVDELVEQVVEDLQEYKGYSSTQAYNALYSGGLKIYSTQDLAVQKICNREMNNDENYPAGIQYSVSWAWSVQHKNGKIENFSESYITYYHRNTLGENSFKLIFNTKEEAKACVEQYKKAMKKKGDKVLGEHLSYTKQPQASFTVMDQKTGQVKAIVGGRGKKTASLTLNRATNTTRQPGSTFKVLGVYAPAIDVKGYTLNSTVVDGPFNYTNGRPVRNWWGDSYKGAQTIKSAIAQSMNIIAVKVITDITPQLGYEYLKNFGITTLDENKDVVQSLALGGITYGVTNLELCAAYATIANGGTYNKPVLYTKVEDSSGKILLDNSTISQRTVIKPTTAYYLTQAMESVVDPNGSGTGKPAAVKNMHVAGKTGTTSNTYDLWFAGYTPYLTATIWTGYDENVEMENGSYHEALWSKIMTAIDEKLGYEDKDFEAPSSMQGVTICDASGKVATENCPKTHTEYFQDGKGPTATCTWHTKKSYSNTENTYQNNTNSENAYQNNANTNSNSENTYQNNANTNSNSENTYQNNANGNSNSENATQKADSSN